MSVITNWPQAFLGAAIALCAAWVLVTLIISIC